PVQPSISPTSGAPGSQFTITDPQGRMVAGDVALFYVEGTDPLMGTAAATVTVSADGTTLSASVPTGLSPNVQHYVSVRPSMTLPGRFNDLAFFVTP
ncbi:MAG TPA: hypothetical protein VN316_02375, partial [candidate division Zixibacteria bacterium]|nr:hypothetical protein [candidate division Zixibacteria bacterium]